MVLAHFLAIGPFEGFYAQCSVSLLGEADLKNQLRADQVTPCLPVAEALANAPAQENNLFVVPKIIE